MKATGIVRRIDQLGRLVMPIELRRTLGIGIADPIEMFVDGENIILRKYQASCTFCDSTTDILEYKGKNICKNCMQEIQKVSAT
jgi:AbrB family transcriptional regulator, transcriptional pleiotropic regulator of transition state genes